MGDKPNLGAYVAARRKTLGLRQNDFAEALGHTNQAISKFESDNSLISILVLPALANLLHLSLNDLVTRNPNPTAPAAPLPKANPKPCRRT